MAAAMRGRVRVGLSLLAGRPADSVSLRCGIALRVAGEAVRIASGVVGVGNDPGCACAYGRMDDLTPHWHRYQSGPLVTDLRWHDVRYERLKRDLLLPAQPTVLGGV